MFETMKPDDLTRMLVTLWAIWHARRKAMHEEIYQSPMATVQFVDRFLLDLEASQPRMVKPKIPKVVREKGRWIPPPVGRVKLNADAAVAKSVAKGAVGVVCRSLEGEYLGASAVVFAGVTHPGSLEAMACREALVLADDLQVGPCLIASDCLEVVQAMKSPNQGVYASVLKEIKALASRQDASFSHERRACNHEAHRLARFASTLAVGRHVWFLAPPDGLNLAVNLNLNE
jgi:ribonuclease HI